MRNRTRNGEVFISSFNEKNRTVSDEHLTEIFARVGTAYGFDEVIAGFWPFKDLKCKWVRTYSTIEFQVSDYLDRAPDRALEELADTLFARIRGDEKDYGDALVQYMTSDRVVRPNRKDFLERSRMSGDSIGEYHDLNDCVDRLRGQNLIPDRLECVLTWDSQPGPKAAGSSVLQRVVWVNKRLDQKGVPEHVLDFCVYAMMCPLIIGFSKKMGADRSRVLTMAQKHPMYQQSLDWLESNDMYLFDRDHEARRHTYRRGRTRPSGSHRQEVP